MSIWTLINSTNGSCYYNKCALDLFPIISPKAFHTLPTNYSHSVQFSHSVVSDSVTPWKAARQGSLSITNNRSSLKIMPNESVMPSNHLILSRPLLLLPSIFPSITIFFKWVSSSHQVAKVLEFQLQHQSFQWFPLGWTGWISLQPKGLSNTTVQKHQFFSAQLSL